MERVGLWGLSIYVSFLTHLCLYNYKSYIHSPSKDLAIAIDGQVFFHCHCCKTSRVYFRVTSIVVLVCPVDYIHWLCQFMSHTDGTTLTHVDNWACIKIRNCLFQIALSKLIANTFDYLIIGTKKLITSNLWSGSLAQLYTWWSSQ